MADDLNGAAVVAGSGPAVVAEAARMLRAVHGEVTAGELDAPLWLADRVQSAAVALETAAG